jgi:hypothetical protein
MRKALILHSVLLAIRVSIQVLQEIFMRDRVYYVLAIAVLVMAIAALVVVLGQNQPTTSQEVAAGTNMQALFTSLAARVNSDPNFSFRVRLTAVGEGPVTVSQNDTRVAEVGQDYFCLTSGNPGRVCYPYSQLLAVAIPS